MRYFSPIEHGSSIPAGLLLAQALDSLTGCLA
jgi:hypothetical protein